jgi:hypothetical protein
MDGSASSQHESGLAVHRPVGRGSADYLRARTVLLQLAQPVNTAGWDSAPGVPLSIGTVGPINSTTWMLDKKSI